MKHSLELPGFDFRARQEAAQCKTWNLGEGEVIILDESTSSCLELCSGAPGNTLNGAELMEDFPPRPKGVPINSVDSI